MATKAAQISKFPENFLPIFNFSSLYSHLMASKGTIGGSLEGPETALQRLVGDLLLKS